MKNENSHNYEWVDPEDQKPEMGQRVIVAVRLSTGNRWKTIAEYIPYMTVRAEDFLDEDSDPDFSDYEVDGTEYAPEGWYESPLEPDKNFYISGQVFGWMALPDFPVDEGQIKKRNEAIANIKAGLRERLDARREVEGNP